MLLKRLLEAVNAAGAWGYRAGSSGAAEPTALAALALAAEGQVSEYVTGALGWLTGLQRENGAVPISAEADSPYWPTGLAALAWLRCAGGEGGTCGAQAKRALGWLLEDRGLAVPRDDAIHDHDTMLVGWPWVAGTHSWVEPTSYAVLALRAAGKAGHARAREAVRLILDRALPEGGWNYGNRRIFGKVLRPFPATTGVALAALGGELREARVDVAIDYLRRELQRVRAPLSLAWGLIGLRAWKAQPPEAEEWLAQCAQRVAEQPAAPQYDALLLLAGSTTCPVVEALEA